MRYYIVYTNTPVKPPLLYAWHGALGRFLQHQDAWHNRDAATGQAIHRYPLIQYKILRNRLALVGLEAAKTSLFELAEQLPKTFWINGRPTTLSFVNLQAYEHRFARLAQGFQYSCENWLPMDSESYTRYRSLCSELDQEPGQRQLEHPSLLLFFENRLHAQLSSHLRSLGEAPLADRLRVRLTSKTLQHHQTRYHQNTMVSMIKGLRLSIDTEWPAPLGIGTGTALGYGTLRKLN